MFKNFLFALLLLVFTPVYAGTVLDEAWSALTDPLGLKSGGDDLLKALNRIDTLMEKADRLAGHRIADVDRRVANQLSSIDEILTRQIQGTSEEISSILEQTTNEVLKIETQLYLHTMDIITCAVPIAGHDIKVLLADSLNLLGASKPRIELFGVTLLSTKIEAVDIKEPIDAYDEAVRLSEDKLKLLIESDSAKKILNIYASLPRLAEKTACHYKNIIDGPIYRLLKDQMRYNNKYNAWLAFTQ